MQAPRADFRWFGALALGIFLCFVMSIIIIGIHWRFIEISLPSVRRV